MDAATLRVIGSRTLYVLSVSGFRVQENPPSTVISP
jgi:hypothetical protein